MIREIVRYGDPVLRAKGKPVGKITDEIREIAADMLESMCAVNGIGLAAQQIGVPLQLAVIDISKVEDRPSTMSLNGTRVAPEKWMPMVLLNPKLERGTERELGSEGCLSFPEISADIDRALAVKATARLIDGSEIEFEASGLLARALQHEHDHLQGILFIDRMNSATKAGLAGKLKRLQKERL
ncbi:MAG: peptide deformylase [Verrucomicrobiota bacterium]|nr:peptide deformylase [Verrucomicrobiota bacterium]